MVFPNRQSTAHKWWNLATLMKTFPFPCPKNSCPDHRSSISALAPPARFFNLPFSPLLACRLVLGWAAPPPWFYWFAPHLLYCCLSILTPPNSPLLFIKNSPPKLAMLTPSVTCLSRLSLWTPVTLIENLTSAPLWWWFACSLSTDLFSSSASNLIVLDIPAVFSQQFGTYPIDLIHVLVFMK